MCVKLGNYQESVNGKFYDLIIIGIIYIITVLCVCEITIDPTTEWMFKDTHFLKAYDLALMALSFVFTNFFWKSFLTKQAKLKTDSAAFNGGQGKYLNMLASFVRRWWQHCQFPLFSYLHSFINLFLFIWSTVGTTMGHEIWNKSNYVSSEYDTWVK